VAWKDGLDVHERVDERRLVEDLIGDFEGAEVDFGLSGHGTFWGMGEIGFKFKYGPEDHDSLESSISALLWVR